MSGRICDRCGKEKGLYGAKTCPKGHFICSDCKKITGSKCPLCGYTMK